MSDIELYRRTIVIAYSLSDSVASALHHALVEVAKKLHDEAVNRYEQGRSKRSPHRLLATDIYVVLRYHELSSVFGLPLQKVALYRVSEGWTLEVDCRSADPAGEVYHFLQRLGSLTGVIIKQSELTHRPSPCVELFTALDASGYIACTGDEPLPRDPRIRRFGCRVLFSYRLEVSIPGFEQHPFVYEAVATHQGFKRNRSPKLARFEFVPITRHGCSPLTFQHARLPAALGNEGWIWFARYIHNLLLNKNSGLPYARVPSYWRGVSVVDELRGLES